MARKRTRVEFEELLYDAVDEALSSLGESAKQAIYYYLEKGFNLNKREIPFRIRDFGTAVEKFFDVGANFLETLILKQLYEKAGRSFTFDDSGHFNFCECVAIAKQSIEHESLEVKI